MAKTLETLARQLRKNHGVQLVPTFDAGLVPGALIESGRWNDLNRLGHLTDDAGIRKSHLGPIEGPTPCMLADFRRAHDLRVDAALDLLAPGARGRGGFGHAVEAVASFESPVAYTASLIRLEDAIEAAEGIWDRTAGQHLLGRRTRVVYRVIRAKLTFVFVGAGGASLDLRATKLRDLAAAGVTGGWNWRNEATVESRRELVVAVEVARYVRKRRRLIPA